MLRFRAQRLRLSNSRPFAETAWLIRTRRQRFVALTPSASGRACRCPASTCPCQNASVRPCGLARCRECPYPGVALLIGDGSFLYNPVIRGLGASRTRACRCSIVVFNNRKYMAMQENHTEYYPDGIAASSGIFYGTHIKRPDYSGLGRPFDFGAGASARRAN